MQNEKNTKGTVKNDTNKKSPAIKKQADEKLIKRAKSIADKKKDAEAKKARLLKEEKAKKLKEERAKKADLEKAKREEQNKAKAEKQKQEKAKRDEANKAKAAENKKAKSESAKQKDKKDGEKGGLKFLSGWFFKKMAIGGSNQLSDKADEVNRLNVFPVPDGDTGDNMRMTIESGIEEMEAIESNDLAKVTNALSHGMLLGARGNSGVILSQFFAGISKGLESNKKADPETLGKALELGVKQAYSSVMTPTEGTILTVAREAVEYAVKRITPKSTINTFFADLVDEMHASVDRTPEILAVLKEAGVVDSGGAGLFYIMDGFNRALNGEKIAGAKVSAKKPAGAPAHQGTFTADSVMEYGYCTEFLLQLTHAKCKIDEFDIEALKDYLKGAGDSIVAFKNDSIVKVHVHTFNPGAVLSHCLNFGEFLTVKIENMSLQHTESADEPKGAAEQSTPSAFAVPEVKSEDKKDEPKKRYGVVAVANGEGLVSLYKDLGTDIVIEGGQTHNPSTQDFIEAFGKINAEHIFVFPNNSNIFMASTQAAELYTEAKVHIVPSKFMGTGYVALSSLDFDNPDVDAVLDGMSEVMANVKTGYLSPSIRDAEINGIHINNGDTIGIIEKEIVVSEKERMDAARALVTKMLSEEGKFMLTVFVGKDAIAEETEALEAYIRETYPDKELYFSEGGQDIYSYICVAE